MDTKVCKKCGKELPLDEFSKSNTTSDGYLSTCKKCRGAFANCPDTIVCPVCNQELPYYNFSVAPRSKTGRMWVCKDCYQAKPIGMSDTQFRKKYDQEYHNRVLEQKRQEFDRHIERYILTRAKNRAKKLGLDFNLELSDIVIPEICPLLEVPIVLGNADDYEYSPSIDRIDNSKGYVKGNVWIISKKANSMKNSATKEELTNFCKNVTRYSLSNKENELIEQEDKEPLG